MTETFRDDELFTVYELTITSKIVRSTGESVIGIEEEGETDLVMKLGMIRLAEDTLLHSPDDDDEEDDD
ncbi:hypothetical protein [Flaviflexus equikiangi]|uniref:Uncharacterized protein n=1 Tax=Flaviflexus equikiangi TaxID=2758573 RepID=A0ABS2TDG5_9ACTO|nr:hypothetical protein [Flaviflexus equikiangi]MBM9432352.1 hypothetical protein [Flaviflexus equikiangi]